MKLIGTGLSPYVQRVLLAARHKGIELEMSPPEGGPRGAVHLALNPMGKIPVLLDGDLVLPESQVILEYLEDILPTPSLYPGDASQRARIRLVTRLLDTYGPASFNAFIVGDKDGIELINQRIDECMRYLDHFWPGGTFAAGEEFSAADCALVPVFCIFDSLQTFFQTYERVKAWPTIDAWWGGTRDTEPAVYAADLLKQAIKQMRRGA